MTAFTLPPFLLRLAAGLCLLFLAACGSPGGLFVSPDAVPVGGNLFVENPGSEDGQLLVLDGSITSETSYAFLALLEGDNRINGLVITQSPGGDLNAAHQIGNEIHRRGINTMVLLECSSACSDIFVSGRKRLVSDVAVFFLHPASDPVYGYSIDNPYWTKRGFKALNDRVYAMAPKTLWRIDAQQALRMGIATDIMPIDTLTDTAASPLP